MTKKPSVFAADDIAPSATVAKSAQVQAKPAPAKPDSENFRTSLYLHRAVHDALREISFHERVSIHDLLREGIDHVLKTRAKPSTSELSGKA